MDFQAVREQMAAFLRQQGVDAVCAYPEERRRQRSGPVAAVSLRACQGGPGGFRDYLGERYDESTGQWQELYGRRVTLTFGLDLYGESAGELQTAYDRMAEAFQWEGPDGLALGSSRRPTTGGRRPFSGRDPPGWRCGSSPAGRRNLTGRPASTAGR